MDSSDFDSTCSHLHVPTTTKPQVTTRPIRFKLQPDFQFHCSPLRATMKIENDKGAKAESSLKKILHFDSGAAKLLLRGKTELT
jgi:hypothetical protein